MVQQAFNINYLIASTSIHGICFFVHEYSNTWLEGASSMCTFSWLNHHLLNKVISKPRHSTQQQLVHPWKTLLESGELAPKLRAQRCLAVSALAMVGPATASCAALVLIWLVDSRRIPARPRAAILNGIAYYDDSCNQQLGKYKEAKASTAQHAWIDCIEPERAPPGHNWHNHTGLL